MNMLMVLHWGEVSQRITLANSGQQGLASKGVEVSSKGLAVSSKSSGRLRRSSGNRLRGSRSGSTGGRTLGK